MPTSKTKPIAKTPAAVSSRPAVNIEPFHEFLTDIFANLVTHGGPSEDDLLYALYVAKWQHLFSPEEAAERWSKGENERWKRRFRYAKRAVVRVEAKHGTQKTISDQVRANTRDYLADNLNEFLTTADPEEIAFMGELLTSWSSSQLSNRGEGGSIHLLNVFNDLLEREERFLRVPEWAVDSMEQHLKWLSGQREELEPEAA